MVAPSFGLLPLVVGPKRVGPHFDHQINRARKGLSLPSEEMDLLNYLVFAQMCGMLSRANRTSIMDEAVRLNLHEM